MSLWRFNSSISLAICELSVNFNNEIYKKRPYSLLQNYSSKEEKFFVSFLHESCIPPGFSCPFPSIMILSMNQKKALDFVV